MSSYFVISSSSNTNAGVHVKDVFYAWYHDPGGDFALLELNLFFFRCYDEYHSLARGKKNKIQYTMTRGEHLARSNLEGP